MDASSVMPIPKQLNSKEVPKWLPKTHVKQTKYEWKENNSTITKLAKAKKHNKPEVWKWIPKQQLQEISTSKYRWIPKLPTTSPQQSPNFVKNPQEF